MKNKRIIKNLISVITLSLVVPVSMRCIVSAATIPVQNPGNNKDIQPNILAALSKAKDGDILTIPEGTFVFNKNITVTKFISFKGAGIGKTILYRAESVSDNTLSNDAAWLGMLVFKINKSISSNITVTDMTLKSKKPSIVKGDPFSLAADIGIKFINCIDFVVSRCRFEYFGNGGISITHSDTLASGLICKNEFYHNAKGFDGLGLGYGVVVYGENKKWITNPRLGSKNFIFIEYNTFDKHRHAIAAGGCALYVARYNTITNNIISEFASTQAIDAHEARGGNLGGENYFSTRAVEVYNNTITNSTFLDGTSIVAGKSISKLVERAIAIRGGEAVIYNNKITGYRFGGAINISVFPWGTSYPLPYSSGYLSGVAMGAGHSGTNSTESNGDVFYWENTFKAYDNSSNSKDFYNYSPSYYKLERDYHLDPKPGYAAYVYPHPLQNLVKNPSCLTDINGDGVTTNNDLSMLLIKMGQPCGTAPCPTDINHDGITANSDLLLLLPEFGSYCD